MNNRKCSNHKISFYSNLRVDLGAVSFLCTVTHSQSPRALSKRINVKIKSVMCIKVVFMRKKNMLVFDVRARQSHAIRKEKVKCESFESTKANK